MKSQVQILEAIVYISHCANTFWKVMHPTILSPPMGIVVGEIVLFIIGTATSQEGKLWIQTSRIPLKIDLVSGVGWMHSFKRNNYFRIRLELVSNILAVYFLWTRQAVVIRLLSHQSAFHRYFFCLTLYGVLMVAVIILNTSEMLRWNNFIIIHTY